MPRLTPTDWRTLERIFEADGWQYRRSKGSHRSYTKAGFQRPIIIPTYPNVGLDIIMGLLRTGGDEPRTLFRVDGQGVLSASVVGYFLDTAGGYSRLST